MKTRSLAMPNGAAANHEFMRMRSFRVLMILVVFTLSVASQDVCSEAGHASGNCKPSPLPVQPVLLLDNMTLLEIEGTVFPSWR
eukprot:1028188-Rhodomonas_salina.1